MSKQLLEETFDKLSSQPYSWKLYFVKIDRRSDNPFTTYKVRFKNNNYLIKYAESLLNMVKKNQIKEIEAVKEYTGDNSKVSCDKLNIDNVLIKEQWDYLVETVGKSVDEKIEGKYQAYILEGEPIERGQVSVIMVKVSNPIVKLENKRNAVFRYTESNELDALSDEICKLYMNIDFVVLQRNLYSFNYKFEELFHMEKTMQKIKARAMEQILEIDAFADSEKFSELAKCYKSPRTFITLKQERIDRLVDEDSRVKVAKLLKIPVDENGKLNISTEKEANLFIKYLCFKIFQEAETNDLLEATSVSKIIR